MGFLGFKQLVYDNGQLVSPVHKNFVWDLGINYRAKHTETWYNHHTDEVWTGDWLHCRECGFHSWKRPEFMYDYSRNTHKELDVRWCVVDNNGFVVEHELGFRALFSKLLYVAKDKRELLDWCVDELADHMPLELISWATGDSTQQWISSKDHHEVIRNYSKYWLENDRFALLTKPSWEEALLFPKGWGQLV